MDQKIKSIKSKKKKAEKKTIDQRFIALNDMQKHALINGMRVIDPKIYISGTSCCPGNTFLQAVSFWPIPYEDEDTKYSS